jgi:hypothetical protein
VADATACMCNVMMAWMWSVLCLLRRTSCVLLPLLVLLRGKAVHSLLIQRLSVTCMCITQ